MDSGVTYLNGHGGYWRTAFLVCLPTSKIALKIVSGPISHAKHAGNIKSDLHPGKPFVAFVALEYKLGFQANIGRFSVDIAGISGPLGLEHKLGFVWLRGM